MYPILLLIFIIVPFIHRLEDLPFTWFVDSWLKRILFLGSITIITEQYSNLYGLLLGLLYIVVYSYTIHDVIPDKEDFNSLPESFLRTLACDDIFEPSDRLNAEKKLHHKLLDTVTLHQIYGIRSSKSHEEQQKQKKQVIESLPENLLTELQNKCYL